MTTAKKPATRTRKPAAKPAESHVEATAAVEATPTPSDALTLSDGEIQGLAIRTELRRDADGSVTHLRCELRDGRLLDVSAGEGVLLFKVAR